MDQQDDKGDEDCWYERLFGDRCESDGEKTRPHQPYPIALPTHIERVPAHGDKEYAVDGVPRGHREQVDVDHCDRCNYRSADQPPPQDTDAGRPCRQHYRRDDQL
ncbi:hypothetical protein IU486_15935 [Streptomyces gardneri]|uniref:hypothetical protein n=1 Tax=Nocardia sputi TaxID=2943705 RepID=UPI00189346E6|nr:hypothetical protein [Nocardia sputi]MBF6166240.1 hypothetical protein [Streptomyces gardneri]